MSEYIEYREPNGAVFLGKIVRREGDEVLVMDARAPPGSRALLRLPAKLCKPAKAPAPFENTNTKTATSIAANAAPEQEPIHDHETKRSISHRLF